MNLSFNIHMQHTLQLINSALTYPEISREEGYFCKWEVPESGGEGEVGKNHLPGSHVIR